MSRGAAGRRILVTGGAGYIGSHVVLALQAAGHGVTILDNLSTGSRSAIPHDAQFYEGDIADGALLDSILQMRRHDAIMHFAGAIVVPDSVAAPLQYYRTNVCGSLALLEAAVRAHVGHFVFSSSAAVYGVPATVPVSESAPTLPINPYGASKLMTEWMLRDAAAAHPIRFAALRYFNVAGADPTGRVGQGGVRATHLIKIACEVAAGKRDAVSIFGTDYSTPDGTAVRDYVHVADLADAHILALDHLLAGGPSFIANCGYGHGYSVQTVVDAVERVAGKPMVRRCEGRRDGDPAELVADNIYLKSLLNWEPRFAELDLIVEHALAWERKMEMINV